MRALVTGSAGFVGRHIAAALEQAGFTVDRADPRHDDVFDRLDCRDLPRTRFMPGIQPPRYDLVAHCAAMVDGREAIDGKAALLGAYNLQLDGALFEWALTARPGRIIYFSSSAAYPVSLQNTPQNVGPLRENELDHTTGGQPDATYGWVKLTGERIAAEVRAAGIQATVVRPFSGYGEDQDDCYPFPAMIARAARRDDPFVVWGDGKQIRDFIHIDDITDAVLTLALAGVDGPVNLGTGRATSMDQLATMAMQAAGYTAPIVHLSDKPSGVRHRVANTTVLSAFYEPTVTLEQGIQRALTAWVPA